MFSALLSCALACAVAQEPAPAPAAAPASAPLSAATPAEVLLLKSVTVHVGAPGEPPSVRDVLIEAGRIRRVEPNLVAPTGARVIDLTGAHAVPGLIDAMVSFDPDHDALYLDAGVTLVRDAGNDVSRIQKLRELEARDRAPGPAVLSALVRIEGNRPETPGTIQLAGVEQADQLLPVLLEQRPDWLYVADALPRAVFERVAAHGAEAGVTVWSSQRIAAQLEPKPELLALPDCVAAGQRALLYMDALLPAGADWESVQPGAFDETVALLGAERTRFVPMLMGLAQRLRDAGDRAPILALLAPMYETQWEADRAMRKRLMEQPDYFKLGERVTKKQRALLKRLHEAGTQLIPGSGAPSAWIAPGQGLHDELALWTDAGVPAAAVLEAATRGSARALGLGNERGSIEPGRGADLLIVDGDPEANLAVLRKPRAVVLRGRWIERAALDTGLDRLRTALEARRARDREPLQIAAPTPPDGLRVLSGALEMFALGTRVSGERWAVVREADGAIAFASRMLFPGDGHVAPREMSVLQRVRDGELEYFEVAMRNGPNELVVKGIWVAGRFSIDRRLNGVFLDGVPIPQHVAAVDVGSVTTPLVLGLREKDARRLPILYFHDALIPELRPWNLELREGGKLLIETPQGGIGITQAPDGSIVLWQEARGDSLISARILESVPEAGGLPPSQAREDYARAKRAKAAASPASAPGAPGGAGATPAPPAGGG